MTSASPPGEVAPAPPARRGVSALVAVLLALGGVGADRKSVV